MAAYFQRKIGFNNSIFKSYTQKELNCFCVFNFYRNGSEWFRIRSEFQRGLSAPASVRNFLPETNLIVKEFVANIKSSSLSLRQNEIPDFLPELSRLNLECMCD